MGACQRVGFDAHCATAGGSGVEVTMRSSVWAAALVASVTGCTGSPSDKSSNLDGTYCGDNAPTFSEVGVTDAGEAVIGGVTRRVLQVASRTDDLDGDLHVYRARIWHDSFEDGVVSGTPQVDVVVSQYPDEPCEHDFLVTGALVAMGPDDIPFGEVVEFGLEIVDAAGHPSNGGDPVIAVFTTPTE